jgi:pimeloyl-ACP methyl ester carboxylesterase
MAAIVAAAEAACAAGETVNLVGHSMGGTTDVAVALALFQRGWVVNNLITIDANLPFGGALPSQIRATNYYRQGGWLHGDPLHGANVTNVVVPNVSHWAITQAVEPEIKGIILGTRKAEPGGCRRL